MTKILLINGLFSDAHTWNILIPMILKQGWKFVAYEEFYDRRVMPLVKWTNSDIEKLSLDADLIIGHSAGGLFKNPFQVPMITVATPGTKLDFMQFHIGNRSDPVVPRQLAGEKNEWRYGNHSEKHEKYLAFVLIPKILAYGISKISRTTGGRPRQ